MRDRTDESTAGHRPDADCGLAPAVTRGVDRRGLLKFAGATLALMLSPVGHAASASLLAVRVWPSPEYTRITLEGSTKLRYSHMLVPDPDRLVIDLEGVQLDSVQDPGNLGTILRTAAAVGIPEVLLTPGCAQAWAPRVLRAAMGAHFSLRILENVAASEVLQGFKGHILAADLRDAVDLYALDLRGPVAWLFGSEGQGLSPAIAALATKRVKIPMPGGMESLNVGVAAGVCLFEQVRQLSQRGA